MRRNVAGSTRRDTPEYGGTLATGAALAGSEILGDGPGTDTAGCTFVHQGWRGTAISYSQQYETAQRCSSSVAVDRVEFERVPERSGEKWPFDRQRVAHIADGDS